MKAIDLAQAMPTLAEVLALASQDNVLLRTAEGKEFVLAEIDDFAHEVSLVRQHEGLMQLLAERSQEKTKLTLSQVREQLQIP
jgi:hypothetical protein